MTEKPGWAGSIAAVVVGYAVGRAVAFAGLAPTRTAAPAER